MKSKQRKEIDSLVEQLYNEMLSYWRQYRKSQAGFRRHQDQKLYDAVCAYKTKI